MSEEPSTLEVARELAVPTPSKIVLLVIDGLGGLPHPVTGLTELETAALPNLDRLARRSDAGLTVPLLPGVTVGSGPGHLALFGYDPWRFRIGRGATSALGVGFPLQPGDVAARINFATVDGRGVVLDRRAGRIGSEEGERLCHLLDTVRVEGIESRVMLEKGHRAVVVFRGDGLSDRLADSDPQREGLPLRPVRALVPEAEQTAEAVNRWIERATKALRVGSVANAVLLRGFAGLPSVPRMAEVYRLRAAALCIYPTYEGVARALGMDVLPAGDGLESQLDSLATHFDRYDFFYLHVKGTDSAGEDGLFEEKVRLLEAVDAVVPRIETLKPEVLAVGGDHSTPSAYREHTWHPVPFLMSSRWALPGLAQRFTERECARGSLGTFPALRAMLLMMAHGGKLAKFGN